MLDNEDVSIATRMKLHPGWLSLALEQIKDAAMDRSGEHWEGDLS